jgi:aspartyl-tRNA(Asn)/glutamyl-tRNA(Gln) amidotransferase subunit C
MRPLSREETLAIAELARLELSPEEADRLGAELAQILEHMDALATVDTGDVEPMTHAVPMALSARRDEVTPSLPPERAMGAAPDHHDDCFRVPRIIEVRGGARGEEER